MALNDIKVPKENAQGTFNEIALAASDLKLGTTANLPLKTGTNGVVEAGAFGTAAGSFCAGDDARLSDARTPSSTLAHKSSHATSGTDALAPSDIGAIFQWSVFEEAISASPTTLATGRARRITISTTLSTDTEVLLPTTGNQDADLFQLIRSGSIANGRILVKTSAGGSTLADLGTKDNEGRSFTFRWQTGGSFWAIVPVDAHGADKVTSGTLDVARLPVGTGSTQVAAGNHTHVVADVTGAAASGSITTSGLTQASARILGRTSSSTGSIEEITIGSGLSLSAGELSSTVSAGIPATIVDAKGDLLVASAADTVARLPVGGTNGHVLTVDSAETLGVKWAAAAGGGVTGAASSASDVLGVSGANITGVDGGLINSANPAVVWNDASGKLVYQNPLERPSGAGSMFVGLAPSTTALGSDAINIQTRRDAATRVASGQYAINIGNGTASSRGTIVIDAEGGASANNNNAIAIGTAAAATGGSAAISIGNASSATGNYSMAIGGYVTTASGTGSVALGRETSATATHAVGCGFQVTASLISQFATRPFSSVYWGGQTTNNTATILNLDATATNRFTIAASTALAVDILLVARRSDTADKWLVARRFLGIRRDGSNNTSLIGSVQTLGTDQSAGSPSWTFALTADDTNEALQLEVTGAASETIQWRATAFYRVA
jgi:hypothetical protein